MFPTCRAAIINNLLENKERTLLAGVNVLTGVHALDGHEVLSALFVFVLVSENDFGKRCATARIVHDVLHNSLDVSKP